MEEKVVEYPAVWIAGASCSGCSVSLLNSVSPAVQNLLVDPIIPGKHVSLRFHATIMAGSGEAVIQVLRETSDKLPEKFILMVEGSVPTGEDGLFCTLGEIDGKEVTMKDMVKELASKAMAAIAVGSCSSFGGIPSGAPNPTGAKSLKQFLEEEGINIPLINVPGCPPHPDWIMGTVATVLLSGIPDQSQLDEKLRLKSFYGTLIHDNCPRRGFFDAGIFAEKPGDEGCLYQLGCKGPYTYADCPIRHWNNGVNWCIGAGAQCIGCVEPDFHDMYAPMFEKIKENDYEKFKIRIKSE
ncbi:MAG: oxidoreductase [Spirochaetes bacterium]|nr:MAG: oxidoreductase [Spirochaetota bacterium]RKY02800.1 MAG: oxidoreductase [Spirochaetota bacterium]